jgi:hypothetical protein
MIKVLLQLIWSIVVGVICFVINGSSHIEMFFGVALLMMAYFILAELTQLAKAEKEAGK